VTEPWRTVDGDGGVGPVLPGRPNAARTATGFGLSGGSVEGDYRRRDRRLHDAGAHSPDRSLDEAALAAALGSGPGALASDRANALLSGLRGLDWVKSANTRPSAAV
jgi:hypothetical protein